MRFNSINFKTIGPFDNTILEFPEEAKLAIVEGPNEAGKTSALKQMLGFMFGFDLKSGDDFKHDFKNHAVHGSIKGVTGRPYENVTRKRGRNSLIGTTESELFPKGLDKEKFLKLFAINQHGLREGAAELFKGDSDLRSLLFDAMTGLTSASSIRTRLAELKNVYAPTNMKRGEIIDSIKAIEGARVAISRHDHDRANKAESLKSLEQLKNELKDSSDALEIHEKNHLRLRNLLGGMGLYATLTARQNEFCDYNSTPDLPSQFRDDWRNNHTDYVKAKTAVESGTRSLNVDKTKLEAIPVPTLSRAVTLRIKDLYGSRASMVNALRDLPGMVANSSNEAKTISEFVQEWLPNHQSETATDQFPTESACRRISDIATKWAQIVLLRDKAQRQNSDAIHDFKKAQQDLDSAPAPEELHELNGCLEGLRESGISDTILEDAKDNIDTALRALLGAAQTMVPSLADIDAIERLRIPPDDEITPLTKAWTTCDDQLRTLSGNVADNQKAIIGHENELRNLRSQISSGGGREEYDKTRQQRDDVWGLIRRRLSGEQVAPETIAEFTARAGGAHSLEEALTGLIKLADSQAEMLLAQADLTSNIRATQAQLENSKIEASRLTALIESQNSVKANLRKDLEHRWAAWNAGPECVHEAKSLQQWMRDAKNLKRELAAIKINMSKYETMRSRRDEFIGNLSRICGNTGNLATLCAQANARIQKQNDRTANLKSLADKLATVKNNVDVTDRDLKRNNDDLVAVEQQWAEAIRNLGTIPPGRSKVFADALTAAIQAHKQRLAYDKRVQDMSTERDNFLSKLNELIAVTDSSIPPCTETTWDNGLQRLQELAETENSNSQSISTLKKNIAAKELEIASQNDTLKRTEEVLNQLMEQAGCANHHEVATVIDRSEQKRRLKNDIASDKQALIKQMAMDVPAYEVELAGRDSAQLAAEADELKRRIDSMRLEHQEKRDRFTNMTRDLGALAVNTEAAEARQKLEDLRAKLEEQVTEWKSIRLAELCLKEAIKRMERDCGDKPIGRAIQFFKRMTQNRYQSLGVDYEADKMILKTTRDNQHDQLIEFKSTDATGLSEGTADQLWLSLRLAGIEARVDQMREINQDPMPIILDDVLVSFDDNRAKAAMEILMELGQKTQVIMFTHHAHLLEIAPEGNTTKVAKIRLQPTVTTN